MKSNNAPNGGNRSEFDNRKRLPPPDWRRFFDYTDHNNGTVSVTEYRALIINNKITETVLHSVGFLKKMKNFHGGQSGQN